MRSDFRDLADSELDADVCIIGGGAAGLTLASELDGSALKVIVLESGGVEHDEATERLNRASSVGPGFVDVVASRRRGLGGATRVWAGQCVPLETEDFESRDWVPRSGWPLELADLDPYYRRAERLLRIPGAVFDERNWQRAGLAAPAWDPTRLVDRFTVWPRHVDLGRLTDRALSRSANVHVLLHATAVELVADPPGRRVEAVEVRTLSGAAGRVRARWFVLAAGGIENARLLLVSDRARPAGLGNDRDLVGRFFQDHPNGFAAEIHPTDAAWLQDRYGVHYRRGRRLLARLALSAEIQRTDRVLGAAAMIVFEHPAGSAVHAAKELVRDARVGRLAEALPQRLGALLRNVPDTARLAARRYLRGRSPDAAPECTLLHVFSEQAPDPASRVTLARDRDPLGVRRARVDWRLGELEARTVATMVRVAAGEFERLGAGRVEPRPWALGDAATTVRGLRDCYHHIGTTRMSALPADGVVDPECRVHGTANLYVSGTSVFPTSGWAHPTFTAIALSQRLADHLRRRPAA